MPKSAKQKDFYFHIFEYVSLCLCLVILSLSMFSLSKYFNNKQPVVKVLGSQVDLEKERQFWTDVVKTSPTYRDGWLELAKIEDELGNHDTAEKYQLKAIQIDPNFFTEEK